MNLAIYFLYNELYGCREKAVIFHNFEEKKLAKNESLLHLVVLESRETLNRQ